MRYLSKSKIISYRQCPKRLWLEIHKPELRDDSASEQVFAIGNEVGRIAMDIYNTTGDGVEIDIHEMGFEVAFAKSAELLESIDRPVFEAGVKVAGGLALVDIMLPVDGSAWKMVEVKSSTRLKDYYRDDAAIQNYLFEKAGHPIDSVSVAHIDNSFIYPGGGDYKGLLFENDLTEEVRERTDEVSAWIDEAQAIAKQPEEPNISCGEQCGEPFECPFISHCRSQEPQPEFPVTLLPGIHKKKIHTLHASGITELADVPNSEINATQQRVKEHTLRDEVYFDREATARELEQYGYPAYFLDFETSNAAVPVWKGTKPFQQIPFQFSVHVLDADGDLTQATFLDTSGEDPRLGFTEELIERCGTHGPIYVYNAGFERRIIREQAQAFPYLADKLSAISERIVDLLPIARNHYYHPSQKGSWSIKAVLPAICPDLSYSELDGVQNGGMAVVAFQEVISPSTSAERKKEIYKQLDEYCKLDTFAMVRMWEEFTGKTSL